MIRTFKHFNEMHMCVQFQINVIQKDLATDCYNKIQFITYFIDLTTSLGMYFLVFRYPMCNYCFQKECSKLFAQSLAVWNTYLCLHIHILYYIKFSKRYPCFAYLDYYSSSEARLYCPHSIDAWKKKLNSNYAEITNISFLIKRLLNYYRIYWSFSELFQSFQIYIS